MLLTPEQLRQNAAAMIAFADGKPIEYKIDGGWYPTNSLYRIQEIPHRPRPEPKTRPWSSVAHVILGAWFDGGEKRHMGCTRTMPSLIVCVEEDGFRVAVNGNHSVHFSSLDGSECVSLDFGKSWQKCEVTE